MPKTVKAGLLNSAEGDCVEELRSAGELLEVRAR
jgi:hypothetical protein